MLKDLGLAQHAAQTSQAVTPLGALARQLYQLHQKNGNGQLDFSSILNMIRPSQRE
jgi:3-hydroxyisobutyrate dehydrogenase